MNKEDQGFDSEFLGHRQARDLRQSTGPFLLAFFQQGGLASGSSPSKSYGVQSRRKELLAQLASIYSLESKQKRTAFALTGLSQTCSLSSLCDFTNVAHRWHCICKHSAVSTNRMHEPTHRKRQKDAMRQTSEKHAVEARVAQQNGRKKAKLARKARRNGR